MKKLFKLLSLLKLVKELHGHRRPYVDGHYGRSRHGPDYHGAGHWHPQARSHHYPPFYEHRGRGGRIRAALSVLLGRRRY